MRASGPQCRGHTTATAGLEHRSIRPIRPDHQCWYERPAGPAGIRPPIRTTSACPAPSRPLSPARLRGGASHEAERRCGARGGRAGRSGATRRRLGARPPDGDRGVGPVGLTCGRFFTTHALSRPASDTRPTCGTPRNPAVKAGTRCGRRTRRQGRVFPDSQD